MKLDTSVITPAEAAFYLRCHLGPLRNWGDFLTDNIREKQSIEGLTLMPCLRQKDSRALRPMYAVQDVKDFVAAVLARIPSAGPARIKVAKLTIDTDRHWTLNKFDRHGTPISRMHRHTMALARP